MIISQIRLVMDTELSSQTAFNMIGRIFVKVLIMRH